MPPVAANVAEIIARESCPVVSSEKIMIVDDDPQLRRVTRIALVDHGFEVIAARSGEIALEQFRAQLPDLVLVDLSRPGMSASELCREFRRGSEMPIIVLSVRDSEKDIIAALDAGADEYLIKPISIGELLARIRAALRRSRTSQVLLVLNLGEVQIDFEARQVKTKSGMAHLPPKEFGVLRLLVSNAGRVVSYRKLLQSVWGPDYGDEVDKLRVAVNQLRKKIERDPSRPEIITNELRSGYRFVMPRQKTLR